VVPVVVVVVLLLLLLLVVLFVVAVAIKVRRVGHRKLQHLPFVSFSSGPYHF
jgi:hypothetical protein